MRRRILFCGPRTQIISFPLFEFRLYVSYIWKGYGEEVLMETAMNKVRSFFLGRSGITAIEYAFLFGLAIFLCTLLIGLL